METLIKNSTTVASIYEAFGKGDIPFIISQLDKNVLWVAMGEKPNAIAGIYKGASSVQDFFNALAGNYNIENFQVHYVQDVNENTVIARGYHEGSGIKTGKPMKTHWAMEWKFNDQGKLTEYRNFYDTQAFANAMS
jgi:ketosteroid isomerase-like protein